MIALRHQIDRLLNALSPYSLFSRRPVFSFMPSFHQCPQCHSNLKVLKTRRRRVATMSLGDITAYEKHLSCSPCRQIYTSEVLDKIVPKRCTFAYDVLVHVGKSLFLRHRNSREVCEELAERNIKISPRECRLSGQEVYRFPGPGPSQCSPRIREFMQAK